jgi:hypothetical protein
MPLLSGLSTGVEPSSRFKAAAIGAIGSEDRTVVRQPLDPAGCPEVAKPLLKHCTTISLTISPEIPAVVATQPMTSRSWLSSANATRTTSPFPQVNSSTSEHQRMLERLVMMVPSCAYYVRYAGPAASRTSSSVGRPV